VASRTSIRTHPTTTARSPATVRSGGRAGLR
jgi:hypothetical protein